MTPLKIKASKTFIEELMSAENGRHEDALHARETMSQKQFNETSYDVTVNDFAHKYKTQIVVETEREAIELYWACATGVIGVRGYQKQATRVMEELKPIVNTAAPKLVKRYPFCDGF